MFKGRKIDFDAADPKELNELREICAANGIDEAQMRKLAQAWVDHSTRRRLLDSEPQGRA